MPSNASSDFLRRETMVTKNVLSCDNFSALHQIFQTLIIQTKQWFDKMAPEVDCFYVSIFT